MCHLYEVSRQTSLGASPKILRQSARPIGRKLAWPDREYLCLHCKTPCSLRRRSVCLSNSLLASPRWCCSRRSSCAPGRLLCMGLFSIFWGGAASALRIACGAVARGSIRTGKLRAAPAILADLTADVGLRTVRRANQVRCRISVYPSNKKSSSVFQKTVLHISPSRLSKRGVSRSSRT